MTANRSPEDLTARQRIIRTFLRAEVDRGQPLTADQVAEQAGVSRTYARQMLRTLRLARDYDPTLKAARAELAGRTDQATADPAQLAALADRYRSADPPPAVSGGYRAAMGTIGARIERLWIDLEVDGGRQLEAAELAHKAGGSVAYADHLLRRLRAEQQRDPTLDGLRAAMSDRERHQQDRLRVAVGAVVPGRPATEDERNWRHQAACRDKDPELFFPEQGQEQKARLAKQVCASCPVKTECLHEALTGPQAEFDHIGIFGGTSSTERRKLRGQPPRDVDGPSAVLEDSEQARAAYLMAWQTSAADAARAFGVSVMTLRKAFDRWQLGPAPGRQGRRSQTPYYTDRDKALEVFRLAEQVGAAEAARRVGVDKTLLYSAWKRHGFGTPGASAVRSRAARSAPPRALQAAQQAFLRLNPSFALPVGKPMAEQLRRAAGREEFETLGAKVIYALADESAAARPANRVWTIAKRVREATGRMDDRPGDPTGRGGRPGPFDRGRPVAGHPADRRRQRSDRPDGGRER